MKRWNGKKDVTNKNIDSFLSKVIALCNEHGVSISHEDKHGAFVIEDFSERNCQWLNSAHDATTADRTTPGYTTSVFQHATPPCLINHEREIWTKEMQSRKD